jgi:hypothetical protein
MHAATQLLTLTAFTTKGAAAPSPLGLLPVHQIKAPAAQPGSSRAGHAAHASTHATGLIIPSLDSPGCTCRRAPRRQHAPNKERAPWHLTAARQLHPGSSFHSSSNGKPTSSSCNCTCGLLPLSRPPTQLLSGFRHRICCADAKWRHPLTAASQLPGFWLCVRLANDLAAAVSLLLQAALGSDESCPPFL